MKAAALLFISLATASAYAQQRDPFVDPARAAEADRPLEHVDPPNVSACFEAFSLPLGMAAELQRKGMTDPDLYQNLAAAAGKAEVKQEILTVLRGRSGQKAEISSVSEQIYPTEYQPQELPKSLGLSMEPATAGNEPPPDPETAPPLVPSGFFRSLIPPALAVSFETRDVGLNIEMDPTLDQTEEIVDLRLHLENVVFAGTSTWGEEEATTEMPTFETQRIPMSATVRVGKPFLLGTFNRPPVSAVDPDSANRVWFGFVTVTLVRP